METRQFVERRCFLKASSPPGMQACFKLLSFRLNGVIQWKFATKCQPTVKDYQLSIVENCSLVSGLFPLSSSILLRWWISKALRYLSVLNCILGVLLLLFRRSHLDCQRAITNWDIFTVRPQWCLLYLFYLSISCFTHLWIINIANLTVDIIIQPVWPLTVVGQTKESDFVKTCTSHSVQAIAKCYSINLNPSPLGCWENVWFLLDLAD